MSHRFFRIVFLFLVSCPLTSSFAGETPRRDLGPTDIVVGARSNLLFLLERDARQIRCVRLDETAASSTEPEILKLPIVPERMVGFSNRKHLAVVGGGPCGRLLMIGTEPMTLLADIDIGHSPAALAIDENHKPLRIYVANRFDGDVSVIEQDAADGSLREIRRLPAGREPIALVVAPGGKQLIVAAHLPEDPAMNYGTAARLRFIDIATGQTRDHRLDVGSINLRDLVLSPDGRYVFVVGQIGHFQQIPSDVTGSWVNENIVFAVDIATRKTVLSHRLDYLAVGSANPWRLSFSDDNRFLVVAAAGASDVILINRVRFTEVLDRLAENPVQEIAPQDSIDHRLPLAMRVSLGFKGVRDAVMVGGRVFASSYFEDVLIQVVPEFTDPPAVAAGVVPRDHLVIPRRHAPENLRDETLTPIKINFDKDIPEFAGLEETGIDAPLRFVPLAPFELGTGIRFHRSFARLGPEPVWSRVRYGEMLFADATLCRDHWQSCVSCHPEGRSDSLNWDLQNDGADNSKNTKSMLLSHVTPPSMALGVRKTAEMAVRKGFETILMVPATEDEADAIDAYLKDLKPVPSPRLVFDRTQEDCRGTFSEAALRGKALFESERSKCFYCHPAPLFTDLKMHDVRSRSPMDATPEFDTPTLVEVWRTAPYLHDGRYMTIKELIVEGKHVNIGGCLDRLTEQEIDDLVEYVLSL